MSDKNEIIADDAVLVKVEGLSKKFCKDLKTSLWYGLKDLVSGVSGSSEDRLLRPKEFWAVKDISFELRRGECLGLIGHNGAGKSTLLKILNGLINPDAGKVTIKGRVGALIELGAGFNPILSGRENIYNNGAILGFSRKEIDSKLETIIAFAELEEFIDMPVQHYSSGMKVRLGFAIAAQMEPDVLIIDEVLAVGDLGFVLKCFKTIDTILPHTAVIFVSHSMPMVSRICSQIILMDRGEVKFQGPDVSRAIDLYYNRFANNESGVVFTDDSIILEKIELLKPESILEGIPQISWGDNLKLYFKFKAIKEIGVPQISIFIMDKEQRPVAMFVRNSNELSMEGRDLLFTVEHEGINLSKGIYSINITVLADKRKEPILRVNNLLVFQVLQKDEIWAPFLLKSKYEMAQ
ncbi:MULTISPECIES: ABC transporter ATP-binding protein [Winogradskyella]|uniref:Lipopolysaccharide transport system ATP-binding protein n=1 Tax=Winogradskyella thalassocola TaxID=262004 RepID=A0A1G8FWU6_9FLAO|nr:MULTISPECIES: ABC transporter ATP-binding protein [Winogradskyella]SDH86591.1 lipopolysaccharide transport system ATP-binding protein [Winogradskyella thalassocola]